MRHSQEYYCVVGGGLSMHVVYFQRGVVEWGVHAKLGEMFCACKMSTEMFLYR